MEKSTKRMIGWMVGFTAVAIAVDFIKERRAQAAEPEPVPAPVDETDNTSTTPLPNVNNTYAFVKGKTYQIAGVTYGFADPSFTKDRILLNDMKAGLQARAAVTLDISSADPEKAGMKFSWAFVPNEDFTLPSMGDNFMINSAIMLVVTA